MTTAKIDPISRKVLVMSTTELMYGYSRSVGAWEVSVSYSGVVAERRSNGDTVSTSLIRFPIGWRVGKRWTNGVTDVTDRVPASVKATASALAGRLAP